MIEEEDTYLASQISCINLVANGVSNVSITLTLPTTYGMAPSNTVGKDSSLGGQGEAGQKLQEM